MKNSLLPIVFSTCIHCGQGHVLAVSRPEQQSQESRLAIHDKRRKSKAETRVPENVEFIEH